MTVIVINIHYRGPSDRFLPHRFRRFLLIHVMGVTCNDSSVSSATSAAYFTPTSPPFTTEDDHVSTVDSVLHQQRVQTNTTQCSCSSSSNNAIVTTDIDLAANFKRIDDRLKRQASYSHTQSTPIEVSMCVCVNLLLCIKCDFDAICFSSSLSHRMRHMKRNQLAHKYVNPSIDINVSIVTMETVPL